MCVCMYVADLDGWMAGRVAGWLAGRVGGWVGGWLDGWMLFGSRRLIENSAVPKTVIQNHELKIVDHYKYLGVTLDQKLDFNIHTQNIYKIAARKIYILTRIRPYINTDAALRIYKSKILPFLDYGDILYDCTFAYLLEKLQKL